LNYSNIK